MKFEMIDISGEKYGFLTVISRQGKDKSNKNYMWLCKCECGKEKIINMCSLRNGCSRSCGCLKNPEIKQKILNNILVDEKGCWNWKGKLRKDGYGRIHAFGKYMPLHKASFIAFGNRINKNQLACHKCDNRKCVNPKHIYAGDYKTNRMDCVDRKRCNLPIGSNHKNSKLTEEQVIEIRNLYIPFEYSMYRISKEFGVCQSAIDRIIKRKVWKHI